MEPLAFNTNPIPRPPSETPESPKPEPYVPPPHSTANYLKVDVALRALLFATTLASVIVMVTGNETKLIPVPTIPGQLVTRSAKFNYSPAFIYFVAALSVVCLYSIITTLLSFFAILKSGSSTKLQFHFVILDALLLGIVAAATGASGGVGYIGLRGNSHSGYQEICSVYHKYCRHFGTSIALSLVAAIQLLLLTWLSVYMLSKRIPK